MITSFHTKLMVCPRFFLALELFHVAAETNYQAKQIKKS